MNTQPEAIATPAFEIAYFRDLLNSEIVLIGGGETVVCGI